MFRINFISIFLRGRAWGSGEKEQKLGSDTRTGAPGVTAASVGFNSGTQCFPPRPSTVERAQVWEGEKEYRAVCLELGF